MITKKYTYHAMTRWHAYDIKTLRPKWSLAKCNEWLEANQRYICDRVIELGWEVIDCLLPSDKI